MGWARDDIDVRKALPVCANGNMCHADGCKRVDSYQDAASRMRKLEPLNRGELAYPPCSLDGSLVSQYRSPLLEGLP